MLVGRARDGARGGGAGRGIERRRHGFIREHRPRWAAVAHAHCHTNRSQKTRGHDGSPREALPAMPIGVQ
jgi:hypothetical protein